MSYKRTKNTVIFWDEKKDKRELSGLTEDEAHEWFRELVNKWKNVKIIYGQEP